MDYATLLNTETGLRDYGTTSGHIIAPITGYRGPIQRGKGDGGRGPERMKTAHTPWRLDAKAVAVVQKVVELGHSLLLVVYGNSGWNRDIRPQRKQAAAVPLAQGDI
jgi:hypothetical protein